MTLLDETIDLLQKQAELIGSNGAHSDAVRTRLHMLVARYSAAKQGGGEQSEALREDARVAEVGGFRVMAAKLRHAADRLEYLEAEHARLKAIDVAAQKLIAWRDSEVKAPGGAELDRILDEIAEAALAGHKQGVSNG